MRKFAKAKENRSFWMHESENILRKDIPDPTYAEEEHWKLASCSNFCLVPGVIFSLVRSALFSSTAVSGATKDQIKFSSFMLQRKNEIKCWKIAATLSL